MAAQDAELKLKVSLDLAFFRQQLSTIGAQLGGQALQLNVQFNKKSVEDQYRLLDRYLGRKTFKTKIESPTLDALVTKVEKLKENLGKLAGEKIALDVEVASNIDDVRKSIKDKLTSVGIKTELAEPVNVDDFIRDVAKKVDDQVKKSYTAGGIPIATKLALPGLTDPLKALQKNLNQKDPLRAKLGTVASIKKADVTALQAAVNEKFKDITVKVRAELDTSAAAAQGPAAGPSRTFLQELKDLDKAVLQSVYRAAGEDGVLAFNEGIINNKALMIQALRDAAKDASDGFVAALENKKSALFKAAGEYAGALLGGLKKELKIQSPSREMFDIGDDAGKGFELGLLKAMELAEKSATNQMRRMLDRLARMALMMGGMSAEQINRQVAQARALPGLDFPATVPPRQRIPIGPSDTGRALPAGRAAAGLIGGAQMPAGLLPAMTARSSIKSGVEALFAAGGPQFPMGPSGKLALSTEALRTRVDKILSDYLKIAEVTVKEIFNPQDLKRALNVFSYLPQALKDAETRTRQARIGIPSARGIAGLLPAASGRAPSTYSTGAIGGETREQMMARRTAEAYARSALRGMDVMGGGAGRPPSPYSYAYRSARPISAIVPYAAGGAMVATGAGAGGGGAVPPSGGGGRGGFGGMGGFGGLGGAMEGLNLPGAGAIRELGSEFAFATKQVLLFGQAYKMLGFLQDFPGQVGQAVAQLQTFRNTLGAVSTSAEDAAESNQMILDLVDKYNVPLQSARDGFTKLYASMAPAGFSGDEIRDLFTGITQAAATFGMSADKVDRVNYAFAQMASKGQVMSEELKGQLGDVLPGAMAIFAEAAGFEGPKAIQEFSAALEDGVYKGEAMNVLLKNVGIVMKQEFGPGAEGAARTFQGVINRMQNSMQLLYESFEPVAVGFLNSVVMPLTEGIKTVSDGFTAFFTGTAAKTAGGFVFAQELEKLRPALDGIRQNIIGLAEQFGQFARVAGDVGKVFLQIAGNPVVGYLARVYANVLILTTAIQLLNLKALIPMITSLGRSAYALIAFTAQCVRAGQSAQVMGLMAQTAGITLRAFFASTGVGIVIVGISMLIERFMSMNQALDQTRQKALGAAEAIRTMSQVEARQAGQNAQSAYQTISRLAGRQGQNILGSNDRIIELTPQELKQLQGVGPLQTAKDPITGRITARRSDVLSLAPQAQRLKAEADYRVRQVKSEEQQARQTAVLAPIPSVEGEGDGKKGKGTQKSGRALSIDELLGGQIKRGLDARRKNLERALQSELNRVAGFDNAEQAERMVRTAAELLDIRYQIDAIDKTIAAREQVRSRIISSSTDKARTALAFDEQTNDLKAKRSELETDIEIAILKQRGAAEKQAREDAAALSDKIEKQKQLNRLIEDAQIAAGIIPPRQAAIIQQQRGFEDAQARVQAEGTPEQLAQLTAVQALIPQAGSIQEYIKGLREELQQLISVQNLAAVSARGIGEALGEAMTNGVASLISGTTTAKEVFANFLQSVGQALSQAASQMIATYIAIGIAKMFAGLGGGGGAPSYSGGKVATNAFQSTDALGLGNSISGGGAFFGASAGTFSNPSFSIGAFANGGVVTGPTLGLIGEGKYNEAVVPLPDGKSIPVQMRGGQSSRDLLSNGVQSQSSPSVLSMSFQSTTINGVEYVSRDQLEAAMMETRKLAARDGANRGASLALDRLQNSPNARRRIGI